jgi:hypothetical protein
MNGKWILAIAIAALLGGGLFAAGLLVGVSFGPGVQSIAFSARQGGPMGIGPFGGVAPVRPQAEPLSPDEARQAVQAYLDASGEESLEVGEVLVFENHAYAVVQQSGSGEGAFEVLVDPFTRRVTLEFGPAMMWNTEYGMMGGRFREQLGARRIGPGGMHGLPGNAWRFEMGPGRMMFRGELEFGDTVPEAVGGITEAEALALAQGYLDQRQSGVRASSEVHSFPGYYTIHTLQDGKTVGMLSVHAETGWVWPHTWHGAFVEGD